MHLTLFSFFLCLLTSGVCAQPCQHLGGDGLRFASLNLDLTVYVGSSPTNPICFHTEGDTNLATYSQENVDYFAPLLDASNCWGTISRTQPGDVGFSIPSRAEFIRLTQCGGCTLNTMTNVPSLCLRSCFNPSFNCSPTHACTNMSASFDAVSFSGFQTARRQVQECKYLQTCTGCGNFSAYAQRSSANQISLQTFVSFFDDNDCWGSLYAYGTVKDQLPIREQFTKDMVCGGCDISPVFPFSRRPSCSFASSSTSSSSDVSLNSAVKTAVPVIAGVAAATLLIGVMSGCVIFALCQKRKCPPPSQGPPPYEHAYSSSFPPRLSVEMSKPVM